MIISKILKAAVKSLVRRYGIDISRVNDPTSPEASTLSKAVNALRTTREIKIEIGSGPVKGRNGWLTIDQTDEADLNWDLNQPLPFPDNSIAMIYSSHVLEHFYYRELTRLLADCCRVLKSGGVFSVCVPDASKYVRAYTNPESLDRNIPMYEPALISDLGMDLLNYIAYMDGHHRYMFDGENLLRVLANAGFVQVRLREFDPSRDLIRRKDESIYALGMKP